VRSVSFTVRAGEIVGIAGVVGNGQDELVGALSGLRKAVGGRFAFGGRDMTRAGVRTLMDNGLAFVPGDRHRYGIILSFPIDDNLCLNEYNRAPFAQGFVRDEGEVDRWADLRIDEFDIRTPSREIPAGTLSGGNQQKVVVAREFSGDTRVLILEQPTRGLDVGSIEFIHRQAIAKRDAGTAILLVSAELDEILELSDRIAVMYRGRIVATMDARGANKNDVGLLMATGGEERSADPGVNAA